MRFQHTETEKDGRGFVTLTIETEAEALNWLKWHEREKDPRKQVQFLDQLKANGSTEIKLQSEKQPWFQCESALDHEFTKPYADLLYRLTGCESHGVELLHLDLTAHDPKRLLHTHITDTLELEHGHLCYRVFIQAGEWNKRTAAENADRNAQDYTEERIGYRQHENEFIQNRNGTYSPNPNYHKRHRPKPAIGAAWIWDAVWQWWREKHATDEQTAVLDAAHALTGGRYGYDWQVRSAVAPSCHLIGCQGLYVLDPDGSLDWDGKGRMSRFVKWDDFKSLGTAATV